VVVTNAAGSTTSDPATLSIAPLALVRHAPSLNSAQVTGSIQQMLGESVTLNGSTSLSENLFVPGTPDVVLNSAPNYGGTLDGNGDAAPANYTITLNGGITVGHVVRRSDPVPLPVVSAPLPPTGTRSVTINNLNQSVEDWSTLRNLTINNNGGVIAVPSGAYGSFSANGGNGFILGVPGAAVPAIYNFQSLTLNNGAQIQIVGPVLLVLGNGFNVNGGTVGSAAAPSFLALEIFAGGLTLNNGAKVYGYAAVPSGTVSINGNTQLVGGIAADRLTINNNGKLSLSPPGN
jgi:hypothetical protein